MSAKKYYQRKRDAKDYYVNDKEILIEHARNKYRNLSKKEKNRKRKNRNNMSEEKKQRLKEYHAVCKRMYAVI